MKADLINQENFANNNKTKLIKKQYRENLIEQINEKKEKIDYENNENYLWHNE